MIRLDDQEKDVFVEIIDFGKDTSAKEMVTTNADGSYTVFINARIAYAQQQDAIHHALCHISKDDFTREDIQRIEAEAHQIVEKQEKTEAEIYNEKLEKRRQRAIRRLRRERKKIQKQLEEYERFIEMRLQCDEQYYREHYLF